MLTNYQAIIEQIDALLDFLKSIQIEAEFSSHLENDYLAAHEFFEAYKISPYDNSHESGRVALGGLHELYKWIWVAKDTAEFEKVHAHLGLLLQAAPKINAAVPMLSPVTGKQDDKSNKFIEAIVGLFAVVHGQDVELDDPLNSSGGENPDAIFTFDNERISVACKTLRSKKPETIRDNIQSAARQISRANCKRGYILLNGMNIVEHNKVLDKVFHSYEEPFSVLKSGLEETYAEVLASSHEELSETFKENPKVYAGVITALHSVTKVSSPLGMLSTSLKGTTVTNFNPDAELDRAKMKFPWQFNEFIHNRDPDA